MKTILSKEKYQLLALLPSHWMHHHSSSSKMSISPSCWLHFFSEYKTETIDTQIYEGGKHKIGSNWWDWKVCLSCGRTVCRIEDEKGLVYSPFTGGIWWPPLGKTSIWGFLRKVYFSALWVTREINLAMRMTPFFTHKCINVLGTKTYGGY